LLLLAEFIGSFTYGLVAVVSDVRKILCSDSEVMTINPDIRLEDFTIAT
jgi:hypothetical protein